MNAYIIPPLEFSGEQDEDLFCDSLSEAINIHPTGSGWSVRTAPIDLVGGCFVAVNPAHPTFEAALHEANEIHRKALERFLEPATQSPSANALLIAAVPEMAAALLALVGQNAATSLCIHKPKDCFGRVMGTWSEDAAEAGRAALRKAGLLS